MAALDATSSDVIKGPGSTFTIRSVLPAGASSDTLTVTLPTGVPRDALPIGPANVFTLAGDAYTRDGDIANVTSHNRSTGARVTAGGGTAAEGAILVQTYCLVGVG